MPHILRSEWTDLSGQLHVVAALNLGKDLHFPFRQIVMELQVRFGHCGKRQF